jgi:hypothetical protein
MSIEKNEEEETIEITVYCPNCESYLKVEAFDIKDGKWIIEAARCPNCQKLREAWKKEFWPRTAKEIAEDPTSTDLELLKHQFKFLSGCKSYNAESYGVYDQHIDGIYDDADEYHAWALCAKYDKDTKCEDREECPLSVSEKTTCFQVEGQNDYDLLHRICVAWERELCRRNNERALEEARNKEFLDRMHDERCFDMLMNPHYPYSEGHSGP